MAKEDVRVTIGGDAKGLKSALADAQGLVSRFGGGLKSALGGVVGSFTSALSSVFSLRGAIATLAGTGGLGLLIKSSIETADNIAKMADRTGLGIEALQELRYAASLAGLDADRFGRAMERLNVSIAESARGTGEAQAAWKTAGIELRDQGGRLKSNEALFLELADAIAETASATTRADIVNKIFGQRIGGQLLPLFKSGAAGIAALREEARSFGVVLDAVMVREAEQAGDQLERVGTILKTNLTRAVLALTPQIISLSQAFTQYLIPAVDWIIQHLPDSVATADELTRRIGETQGALEALAGMSLAELLTLPDLSGFGENAGAIRALLAELLALDDLLKKRVVAESLVQTAIQDSGEANTEYADKTKEVFDALQFELEQLGRTKDEQDFYAKAKAAGIAVTDEFRATILPVIEMLNLESAALDATTQAQKDQAAELEKLKTQSAQVFEATRTPLERYQAQIEELNGLLELHRETLGEAGISWETYARAVEKAQDDLEEAEKKTREVDDAARDLGLTFSSAFEDALVKGAELRDVLQGVLDDIIRIGARKAVTEPLAGLFTGIFDSLLSFGSSGPLTGPTGGLTGGGVTSAKGNVFAGSVLAGAVPLREGFGGRVVPHGKGGVLTSPIAFPMAGGRTGTAAESEDEAILPLARDAKGRLGVRATGGGDGEDGGVVFIVNDYRQNGAPVEARQSRAPDGRKQIEVWLRDAVNKTIRSGGADDAMQEAFGLRRGGGISR